MKGEYDISQIDSEDRVHTIGKYNGYVNFCVYCYPDYINLGVRTVVGYGTDDAGNLVEVHECPVCHERQYHHFLDMSCYEIYKMFKNKE